MRIECKCCKGSRIVRLCHWACPYTGREAYRYEPCSQCRGRGFTVVRLTARDLRPRIPTERVRFDPLRFDTPFPLNFTVTTSK